MGNIAAMSPQQMRDGFRRLAQSVHQPRRSAAVATARSTIFRSAYGAYPHRGIRPTARRRRGLRGAAVAGRRRGALHLPSRHDPSFLCHGGRHSGRPSCT
jgi:hypothetical protein